MELLILHRALILETDKIRGFSQNGKFKLKQPLITFIIMLKLNYFVRNTRLSAACLSQRQRQRENNNLQINSSLRTQLRNWTIRTRLRNSLD